MGMFETAVSGVITIHAPVYGDGREPAIETTTIGAGDEKHAKEHTVDFPQFLSIVRTLWPAIGIAEAVTCYREGHEASRGKVDYECFMKVAEQRQFFTHA